MKRKSHNTRHKFHGVPELKLFSLKTIPLQFHLTRIININAKFCGKIIKKKSVTNRILLSLFAHIDQATVTCTPWLSQYISDCVFRSKQHLQKYFFLQEYTVNVPTSKMYEVTKRNGSTTTSVMISTYSCCIVCQVKNGNKNGQTVHGDLPLFLLHHAERMQKRSPPTKLSKGIPYTCFFNHRKDGIRKQWLLPNLLSKHQPRCLFLNWQGSRNSSD